MNQYIDVHHHILPPFYRDALINAGIEKQYGIKLPEWSVESSMKIMSQYNIEAAITSISTPGVCIGEMEDAKKLARHCNDYAAELSKQYPKTFGSFATLPLPHIDSSLEELEYSLDKLKMEGVTLLSNYDGKLLGDDGFNLIFEALNYRGSTVFIHPTIPSPCCAEMGFLPASMFEFVCDSSRTIMHLLFSGIFERYANVKFIIPHAGGVIPYLAGRIGLYETLMPALKEKIPKGADYYLKNLYYDTAMSTSAATLKCLTEFVPVENILTGTDYPFVSEEGIRQQLNLFEQYEGLARADKELICHKNMRSLFSRFK